jgi:hypothetical protein
VFINSLDQLWKDLKLKRKIKTQSSHILMIRSNIKKELGHLIIPKDLFFHNNQEI